MSALFEAWDAIRNFANEHPGTTVLSADNPERLSMGWVAYALVEDTEHSITQEVRLTVVKEALGEHPWLKGFLQSAYGRQVLAKVLAKGKSPQSWGGGEDGAYAIAKDLQEFGFTPIPKDNVERGLGGLALIPPDGDGRHTPSIVIEWPLFGQPLTTHIADVTPEELSHFLTLGPTVVCSNIEQMALGFVKYEPEQGRALVRRTTLSEIQAADPQVREALFEAQHRLDMVELRLEQHRTRMDL